MTAPTYTPGQIVTVNWPILIGNNGLPTCPLLITSVNDDGTVNGQGYSDAGITGNRNIKNATPITS